MNITSTDFEGLVLVTAATTSTPAPEDRFVATLRMVISIFQAYALFPLVFIGMFGNILSIVVFTINKKNDMVSAQYLRVLAVSDSGMVLLVGLRNAVAKGGSHVTGSFVGFDLLNQYTVPCKIFRYIELVCQFLSSYIIVMFSLERALAVWMPLRMVNQFTVRRRYVALVILVVVGAVMRLHILVTFVAYTTETFSSCWYPQNMPAMTKIILVLYDLVPNQAIPCLLIFILNIIIGVGVKRSSQKVKVKDDEQLRRQRRDFRCVVNLLVVSTIYFIFTSPQSALWLYTDIAMFILSKFDPSMTEEYLGTWYEISRFADSINMFNYCLNFIIYGVSLQYYRRTATMLVTCYSNKSKSKQV